MNNKSNHRIKGIKVYGTTVQHDGTLVHESKHDKFHRPNCETWRKPVYCPDQHVATKVTIHHTKGEANGLGLVCRKVVEKKK